MTSSPSRAAVAGAAEPSPERLLELLRQMVLIRRFDETALELIWSRRIDGVVHPYVGQESSAVGICAALRDGDRVVSNHRGHGHCIAAGTDVQRMMAELFGRTTGCCGGKGGSMHIADFGVGMLGANGIVGAGGPMAVGAALSDLLDGAAGVTAFFFGDGATGQGIVYESLNLAALWRLPVLFVCENNGVASGTPLEQTLPVPGFAQIAGAHGVAAEAVDGNDVTAVLAAATGAVARLRAGAGPQLIECVLDRWGPHASRQVPMADERDPALLEQARSRDPIERLRARLADAGQLDADGFAALRAGVERELEAAIAFAEASPYPELDAALEDVFA